MTARQTYEEIKAAKAKGCPIAWMKCKEIERAGSFAAWESADRARIEADRPAAQAWAKAQARRLTTRR